MFNLNDTGHESGIIINDIPALFGFFVDGYDPEVVTYAGTIWKFEKSDTMVITIDSWN